MFIRVNADSHEPIGGSGYLIDEEDSAEIHPNRFPSFRPFDIGLVTAPEYRYNDLR